jgi:hypothetical protein
MAPLALMLAGFFPGAQPRAAEVCHDDMSTAASRLDDATAQHVEIGNPTRATTAVLDAARLFRFDRRQDALRKLDAALALLSGAWGRTLDADRRRAASAAVKMARRCVETHRPPPLATLVVRTFLLEPAAPRGVGAPAGAGVLVFAEGTRVGQTGTDGVATVRIPPGKINVLAQKPLAAGEAEVAVPSRGSGAVSIVLSPDRHDLQVTDLVLVDAPNDIVSAAAPSFTFKFMRDGVFVPMTDIDAVEIVDGHRQSLEFLQELFAIAGGTVAATDPGKVSAVVAKYTGQHIGVHVQAVDAAGFRHSNVVWLRIVSK